MSPEVKMDEALRNAAADVARELVPNPEDDPERHRIIVALAVLLYREAQPILPPDY